MKAEEIRKKAEKEEGKLRTIRIEEWNLDIYYRPYTVEDEERFDANKELTSPTHKGIEVVMHKALDEDGNRIWTTEEHRQFLRSKCRNPIVTKIFNGIFGISFENAKKN